MKFNELFTANNDDDFMSKLRYEEQESNTDVEFLKNIKIGDSVNVCAMTSFGNDSKEVIAGIKIKYDEDSGEPYNVIQIGEDWLFDSRTGNAITSPTMYFLSR